MLVFYDTLNLGNQFTLSIIQKGIINTFSATHSDIKYKHVEKEKRKYNSSLSCDHRIQQNVDLGLSHCYYHALHHTHTHKHSLTQKHLLLLPLSFPRSPFLKDSQIGSERDRCTFSLKACGAIFSV